jgi:CelD/BcsL family acetyltransferase involved in cellulose biosynthesis
VVETELVQDVERFEQLREDWNELLRASCSDNLFLTFEWLHAWWRHLGEGRQLHVLVARDGGRLVAAAPCALRPGRLFRRARTLEFLGTGMVGSDYLDVLVRHGCEGLAIPALAAALARLGASIDLRQLPAGSSFGSRLLGALGEKRWGVSERETDVCPFIPLAGRSWETYLASLGPGHRYNVGRRTRALQRHEGFYFERVESEDRRRDVLAELFRLHDLRWRDRGGSEAFASPPVRAFHEDVSRTALERGWLRLFALHLDGVTAAVLYAFRYGPVCCFYQSGFDPRYARQSVGLVILGLSIRSAIEEGAAEFDLLHGDEPYKSHWARERRVLARAQAYPRGGASLVLRAFAGLEGRGRRLARRLLPEPIVQRVRLARRSRTHRAPHAAPAR